MLPLIFAYFAGVVSVFLWAYVRGTAVLNQRMEEMSKEKEKENE